MKFEQKEKIVILTIAFVFLICFSLWDWYNLLWIIWGFFLILWFFWFLIMTGEKFSIASIWLICVIISAVISYIFSTEIKVPDSAWEIWMWYFLSLFWILLGYHILKKFFGMKWWKPLILSTSFMVLVIMIFLANNYWFPVFEYIWKALLFIIASIIALEGLYRTLWIIYMIVVYPLAMLIQKLVWYCWINISDKLSVVLSIIILILIFLLTFTLTKNRKSSRECFDRTSIDWNFENDMKCIDENGNVIRTDYEWAKKLMWK